jgi:hypothetical protein
MFGSGLNSDAKKITMRLPEDRGETLSYNLDYAQVRALLVLAESISWRTRHTSLPAWINEDFTLRDFADETIKALLTPIMTGDCGDDACIEYPAASTLLGYAPQNPMFQPDYTPTGYTKPPFYIFHDQLVNFGAQEGDVIVDFTSLTSVTLGQIGLAGMPRIRIPFDGIGQMELELLKIPQGGLCYITKDGSPIGGSWVDLSSVTVLEAATIIDAILEIGFDGTYVDNQIHEINFDTAGSHYVDITFLPNVNTNVLLGFGGGIRSVRICKNEGEVEVIGNIRLKPDTCSIIQQFIGDTWTDIFDLSDCDELVGEDGVNGENGASPEIRVSGGYIQWKLETSDTWIDLILVSSLVGATGATGATGSTGATGATGAIGEKGDKGDKGDPGNGNVYPPKPTSEDTDELCNAATYIVDRVRDLIVEVYSQLSTLEPNEVLTGILGTYGWNFTGLLNLITSGAGSLEDEIANLSLYDAAKQDLICELISLSLDRSAFIEFIDDTYENPLKDLVKYAVEASEENGKYALWAAIGTTIEVEDCGCEEEECITFDMLGTAGASGQASGFTVISGNSYTINATGTIVYYPAGSPSSTGPDGLSPKPWGAGILPSAGVVELIAKIGSGGTYFSVGSSLTFTASSDGELYFTINELDYTTYADNSGSFEIEICPNS